MKKIAVVGGGMAGLAAAWKLKKAGANVTVFEREPSPGGRTSSVAKDGYILDTGAVFVLPTYTRTLGIIRELGIADELIAVKPKMGILRDGKRHQIDLAHPVASFIKTPLFSLKSKLSLFKLLPSLVALWRKLNFTNVASIARYDSENARDFCLRVLNQELHDYLLDPIVRINMLNKTHLASSGEIFWLLKSFAAPSVNIMANGTRTLSQTLADKLHVIPGAPVEHVEERDGQVTVSYRQNGELHSQVFDGCIVTAPPHIALQLVPTATGAVRDFFEKVQPVRHFSIHLGLSQKLDAEESLILGSEKEAPHILGIVIDPNRAPDRAQAGKSVVSVWMTIEWSAERWDMPDSDVLAAALDVASPILGNLGENIEVSLVKRQDYSCYQGYPGYYRNLERYMNNPHRTGAIRYAGDFAAIGIEGAVISGEAAAQSLIGETR